MTYKVNAVLEIDPERGVIYIHDTKTSHTVLRICKLPKPIPTDQMLDITHMIGTNWREKEVIPLEESSMIKIKNMIRQGVGSGTSNSEQSLAVSRAVKKALVKAFPDCKVIHSTGHFYCSGFVRRGERVVYYSVSDFRYFPDQDVMVRHVNDEKDFTGGLNHYSTWEQLEETITSMLM
ncbi:MAG: hypothetical protein Q8M94_15075 [Ignavibacteria bacterium]|nr:hypothetical protein [Ignavibacteria bacterium]